MTSQVMAVALIFVFIFVLGADAGTNFDATWTLQCPTGQTIYRISSVHSNPHEDRSWSISCTTDSKLTSSCTWTSWVNNFDKEILFQCRHGVITGIRSEHSNQHEDRRYAYKCCRTKNDCTRNCYWTGYLNNFDQYMNYNLPDNFHLVGVQSYHDNGAEDRRWRFLACQQG